MQGYDIEQIREKISEIHQNDPDQLEVIFSDDQRILVEAPAGYGKTTTIIGKLAYTIATNQVSYPKKILALTFSVNAALKMRREVSGNLPEIIGVSNNPGFVSKKITISNYHGFCKYVLKRFGHLVDDKLIELDTLFAVDEKEVLQIPGIPIDYTGRSLITGFQDSVQECKNINFDTILSYNKIITNALLPAGFITHNAILSFTIQLLNQFAEVRRFLTQYYPMIIVDEFQDTNILFWWLIDLLIEDKTKLLFVGDHLQKIYSFIGAIPNILDRCQRHYGMEKIYLNTNYRFTSNPEMLKLDSVLRKNAEQSFSPEDYEKAALPYHFSTTQYEEADWIATRTVDTLQNDSDDRVAILVKSRGMNTDIIETALQNQKIPYFYGLFTDVDSEYLRFHSECLSIFIEKYGEKEFVSSPQLLSFAKEVEVLYSDSASKTVNSLVQLLYALVEKIKIDYKDISPSDRKNLMVDIFANNQLKQSMEYVSSKVILTTIHSAKGLEWDYVYLADVEKFSIPFFSVCKNCRNLNNHELAQLGRCNISKPLDNVFEKAVIDEFCVFYVALTRARKQVFISSSQQRFNSSGKEFNNSILSCFATLPGITLESV